MGSSLQRMAPSFFFSFYFLARDFSGGRSSACSLSITLMRGRTPLAQITEGTPFFRSPTHTLWSGCKRKFSGVFSCWPRWVRLGSPWRVREVFTYLTPSCARECVGVSRVTFQLQGRPLGVRRVFCLPFSLCFFWSQAHGVSPPNLIMSFSPLIRDPRDGPPPGWSL